MELGYLVPYGLIALSVALLDDHMHVLILVVEDDRMRVTELVRCGT